VGGWHVLVAILLALPALGVGLCVLATAEAQAQGFVIRDIQVVGNKRVEPETVRSYLKFSTGDGYDAGKVDQSVQALFGTGLFSDVRIDREGTAVVVTVVENPVIHQVAFEGNREAEKDTLQSEVQLKPRSIYTRARVQADVQRILDVYRRQGRFAATVDAKIIELDNNRVNLVYEINEGETTKVKSISFIGNRAFSDSQLRDIITTTQSGFFDFLKTTSVYDPDRLNLDRELLRQYYLKNGYADARVVSAGAELDRDGSGFYITFVIEEGELFSFGKIDIESQLPGVNTPAMSGEVLTKPGDTYNMALIDKTAEKLTLIVSEQGFAFARVRPRADRDLASHAISVTYVIDEGPRIYIERINITGNLRTRDYVIRREFRLAEGDAYNPLLVDRAKTRLQALGFFKSVDIKRRPGSAPDQVVLDVDLVEQSSGELSFGAGYSTSEGVIGDVSITERNLLGRGQFLRLRLAGSQERLQADLSFTEPRFLDQNLSAGFDIFHKDVSQTKNNAFESMTTGGTLRLGVPLSENLWFNTSYTLERNEIFNVSDAASLAIKEAKGTSWTSMFGTSLVYDQRNHPKNPNKGYYLQVGTDFAGAGGDVRYVRVQGEARGYYPITEKITFVGRAIGGDIEGWGGQDVRLIDLFYKGGETIRGFNRGGYGPRDLLTGDALGGKIFWATTAEVRYPFPFIPDDLGLSGAVFVDAGSLFSAGQLAKNLNTQCPSGNTAVGICLADSASVRASAGGSLIWASPLGPLRLDVAYPFLKQHYDDTQIIRFGASTKF
jgi:outer membrane protein insertion porin family